MKKLLLFTAMIVIALTAFTQNFPIDTVNANWIERNEHGEGKDLTIEYFRYFVDGDTIFEGQKFFKIYEEEEGRNIKYMGAFREVDGKVYYKGEDYWGPNTDTIVLMYDFTAEIDDTVRTGSWQEHIIEEVDSVMVEGQLRKRLYTNWNQYWIEGIGSLAGFLFPVSDIPISYWRVWISCYYIDNELIYLNPEFNDCYDLNGAHDIELDQVLIAPNPIQKGEIFRILNVPKQAQIILVDINGKRIQVKQQLSENQISIYSDGLAKGLYLVQVITPANQISKKIVIQ